MTYVFIAESGEISQLTSDPTKELLDFIDGNFSYAELLAVDGDSVKARQDGKWVEVERKEKPF